MSFAFSVSGDLNCAQLGLAVDAKARRPKGEGLAYICGGAQDGRHNASQSTILPCYEEPFPPVADRFVHGTIVNGSVASIGLLLAQHLSQNLGADSRLSNRPRIAGRVYLTTAS
jgi:hypothetical protein